MVNQSPEKNLFCDEFSTEFPACRTLAKARKKAGLSQSQLGYEAGGIPGQRISNLENGTDRALTREQARRISKALGGQAFEIFPEYYWRFDEEYISQLESAVDAAWRDRAMLSGDAIFSIQKVREVAETKRITIPDF
jgi:transcriptional regulator with XRE-family HTH domain